MPSPFPGVDPWLEGPGVFPDLKAGLLAAFSAALNAAPPEPFYSALAAREWVEESECRPAPGERARRCSEHQAVGGPTVLEIAADAAPEEERESVVEVYTPTPTGRVLVASVELLSAANKTPGTTNRGLYRAKQRELVGRGVHVLEVDLLRRGTHATLVPRPALEQRAGAFDYHTCLTRADRPGVHLVTPFRVADPLPPAVVPLTPGVADVRVELQPVLARTYDAALYSRRVDYAAPCDPPLSEGQAAWAAGVLAARGATA